MFGYFDTQLAHFPRGVNDFMPSTHSGGEFLMTVSHSNKTVFAARPNVVEFLFETLAWSVPKCHISLANTDEHFIDDIDEHAMF